MLVCQIVFNHHPEWIFANFANFQEEFINRNHNNSGNYQPVVFSSNLTIYLSRITEVLSAMEPLTGDRFLSSTNVHQAYTADEEY